jgi:hypothetical protein
MATIRIYEIQFQVVKLNPTGKAGPVYQYRKELRKGLFQVALVQRMVPHPKDLLTVLNANIPVSAGESIEILNASQLSGGTESEYQHPTADSSWLYGEVPVVLT